MKAEVLWASAAFACAGLSLTGVAANAEPVTPERLANLTSEAEMGNWLTVHRTYDSHRYSPLNEINAENVSGLKLAFAVPLGGSEPTAFGFGAMETTPLVDNGKMYLSDTWGTPYKIDVSSGTQGQVEWVCDTGIDKDPSVGFLIANRGVAVSGDLVITNLADGRVLACDEATGDVVWDKQIGTNPGEGFTGAPLAVGDKVIVGQSYGDWATRGFIAALDAKTGEEVWRTYTIPAPGEPGSETWECESTGNPDCWKTGGAAAWGTGSYDIESNTIIYGTGNPVPMFDPEYRPGINLYSDSTLALDGDTGEIKWHFQYTPGDYLDYDAVGTQLLIDKEIDGESRRLISHFGRNGFFYSIDRTNGAFVKAGQYVEEVNWTEGIDPKTGKPLNYDPEASLQAYAEDVLIRRDGGPVDNCPHIMGGINFWPTSYNEATGLAYGHSIEGCGGAENEITDAADVAPGTIILGGAYWDSGRMGGSIIAVDPATGQTVNKVLLDLPGNAGVLNTPDLVWFGELDGTVNAYDANTLEKKWSINVGTAFKAPPMTYSVNGKQYVAITGGTVTLTAFGHPELEVNRAVSNMLYVFTL